MNIITGFVNSPWGYAGIGCALVLMAFYVYGEIVKTITQFKMRDEDVGNLREALPEMKATLKHISEQVKDLPKIRAELNLFLGSRASNVAETQSPLSLNDTGQELSISLDAQAIIDKHYDEVKNLIDAEEINNAFDIQQVALSVARSFFTSKKGDDLLDKAKQIAYDKGISSLDLYTIFGILLRDKLLSERNVSRDEIDKHDPSTP